MAGYGLFEWTFILKIIVPSRTDTESSAFTKRDVQCFSALRLGFMFERRSQGKGRCGRKSQENSNEK
jgi:hypothetical protein